MDREMDGPMDGRTDQRMDGRPSRTRDQRDASLSGGETAVRRAPDAVGVEPRIHLLPPIKAIRQGKLWNVLKVLITINPVWEKW